MELALGTVQFGLAYGIAGRRYAVPEEEARSILECAWARGVRMLDTAAAYGDIEQRLGRVCEGLPFRIISKVSAIPLQLDDIQAAAWAKAQAMQSRQRLGNSLSGLMFHKAEDLSGERGLRVWQTLTDWAQGEGVALGASCYSPQISLGLRESCGISLTQLPGNAFDQRIVNDIPATVPGLEIHLRSAFLQGLLLMPLAQAQNKLPLASNALKLWHKWCAAHSLSPLVAALSIVKSFASVSVVVVGVDSLVQFDEIASAWDQAHPRIAAELAVDTPEIIDPRFWKA
jgi:aryl-alcohol dehydrogenase-like predicted oxidoreductase